MYSWIFGRRRSNAYFSESLVSESNKMVFGHRFKHIQHLHQDSTDRGLNTIALPNQGLDSVGVHRSSMPCTPAATPSWEYSLTQARQFTEETFRDRLLIPKKGKRRAHIVPPKADINKEAETVEKIDGRPPIYPGHPMLGGTPSSKKSEEAIERKVFVGNISYKITQKQLKEFFSKFGRVVDCHIVYDHYKRKSKGIGFVTFINAAAASKAKEASVEELTFDQREMRVLACEAKKRDRTSHLRSKDRESSSEDESELRHQSSTDSSKSATIMEEGHFYINDLPDDILIIIFFHLPIRDRVRLERVCVKWKVLSVNSWKMSNSLKLPGIFSIWKNPLTNQILRSLLKRCSHIKDLDLSEASHILDSRAVGAIAHLCPNLRTINLTGVPTSNTHLQQLASKCSNLKEVILRKNLDIGERGLWSLFNQCKQLIHIDVSANSKVNGKCFHMLGPKLKEVILDNCYKIQPIGFSKLALRCPKMKKLSLNDCRLLNDRCMKDICCNLRRLKVLNLSGNFPDLTCGGLFWLGELTQLEEISMSQNNLIDDLVLQALCEGCLNLKVVDVSSCNEGITDLGLRALAQLTYLNVLNVSYLNKISDNGIEEIAKRGVLEKLITRGCSTLTGQAFVTAATLCIELQLLDVCGCDLVSNATIHGCIDALSLRNNNLTLKIIVGGTSCIAEEFDVEIPNLVLNWNNLCQKYLRPNSMDFDTSDGNSELSCEASGYSDKDAEMKDFLENDDPMRQYEDEMGDMCDSML